MRTIKQYAKEKGVTYEAVRKQIERCMEDLTGHIVMEGGVRCLDDYAMEYLDAKRRGNPITRSKMEKTDEVDQLRAELENVRNMLLKTQSELIEAQRSHMDLLEARALYKSLEASSKAMEDELSKAREQRTADAASVAALEAQREADRETISRLTAEKEAAQTEAQSFERTWFGLYRKK